MNCVGEVAVQVEGEPFDSFLTWVALGGLLVSGIVLLIGVRSTMAPRRRIELTAALSPVERRRYPLRRLLGLTLMLFGLSHRRAVARLASTAWCAGPSGAGGHR